MDFGNMLNQLESIIGSLDSRFTKMTTEQRKSRTLVGLRRKGFIDLIQSSAEKTAPWFRPISIWTNLILFLFYSL
jgi:hypothetical protein